MNKKNLLLIALLAILLLIFVLTRGQENEKRSNLFKFKQAELTKIEIVQHADTLVVVLPPPTPPLSPLAKGGRGGGWYITHPIEFPAKKSQIERFFDDFLSMTVSNIPVSEMADRQSFYSVDEESGTIVSLYGKNGKLLKKVFVGRSSSSPQNAYIRADKDNKIYQINNITGAVNPSLSLWREDMLIPATVDDLQNISVKSQVGTYSYIREKDGWSLSIGDGDTTKAGVSFENYLNSIVNLRSSTYWDNVFESYAEKLAEPALEMEISLKNGQSITLKIAQNDENSYVLQKDGVESTLYRLTNSQFGQLNTDPMMFVEALELNVE